MEIDDVSEHLFDSLNKSVFLTGNVTGNGSLPETRIMHNEISHEPSVKNFRSL